MADLATAEVALEVDFANLEPDVRKGLEERVTRAARSAQKELDKTTLSAAALGDVINKKVGAEADKAAVKVRRAARAVQSELAGAGDAAEGAGKKITRAGTDAAEAIAKIGDAAEAASDSLFDIDDAGLIKLNHAIEDVQTSLFDLDTVELEKGLERSTEKAATFGQTLRANLREAARTIDIGIGVSVLNLERRLANLGNGIEGRGLRGFLDELAEIEPRSVRANRGIGRVNANLISLVALAVATAPPLIAAGAAVGAFAALAAPAIVNVIKAQKDMAAEWSTLTRAEKIAALQTSALVDEYLSLSKSFAPAALRVYNGALSNTAAILPKLKPLFDGVLASLQDANQAIGAGFDTDRARGFFTFLGAEAGPAVDALIGVLIDLAAAVASLIQTLAPLAGAGLGVISFMINLLTAVSDVSPALVQFAVLLVTLRGPLGSLGNFFVTTGNKAKGFASATKGATLASRALNLATAAGPAFYLAAAAAVVLYAVRMASARTEAARLTDTVNANNRAVGNNIAGYQAANKVFAAQLAPSTARVNAAVNQLNQSQTQANLSLAQGAAVARNLSEANVAAGNAYAANKVALDNIDAGSRALAATYGITQESAIRLADTIGINLSKNILDGGVITASTADKIARYREAVELANNPTLSMATSAKIAADATLNLEDRIKGLNATLAAAADPAIALFAAENRLREVNASTAKVIKDRTSTESERRVALERSIGSIREFALAEFGANKNVKESSATLAAQLPKLLALAGNSEKGKNAVFRLRDGMVELQRKAAIASGEIDETGRKIRDLPKNTNINIYANTRPAQNAFQALLGNILGQSVSIPIGIRAPGTRTGGFINRAGGGPLRRAGGGGLLRGPGSGTSDSIPAVIDGGRNGFARLSNKEYVINAKATKRHFGLIEAINAGRFASGGYLGRARAFAAGGQVRGYATGGQVSKSKPIGTTTRKAFVDIGRLLGDDIAKGLRGTRPAIEKEVTRIGKSLEKKILAIGVTVGTGFVKKITDTPGEINTALTSLSKTITRTFTGIRTRVDDQLVARLGKFNTELQTLARRRDVIAKQLEEATALAASVTDRARSFAALGGFDADEGASVATITKTLRDRLDAIRRFQRDVAALTQKGLDKGLIRQIAEGGPEQSGALARTLAQASRGELAQISAVQRQIDASTKRLGRDTADSLFDAGVQAGKGFLTGLQAQRKEIIALMTEIAKSVAKTVKTTLKIKSPSRVLRAEGIDTMLGYIDGVRALARRVRATVAAAVRPDPSLRRAATIEPARNQRPGPDAPAPPGPRAPAAGATITQNNHFHNVIADPHQIIAVTENRLVSALRGA